MKSSLKALADRFWAVPLLFAIAATALALGVTSVDESLDTSLRLPFLFAGGPEGARALLAAIITSMISFTALVFSITIVVLQLTSSQFSPGSCAPSCRTGSTRWRWESSSQPSSTRSWSCEECAGPCRPTRSCPSWVSPVPLHSC